MGTPLQPPASSFSTAPTERAPSRGSASNAHPGRGNVDRWRPGGLRSIAAAIYEGCIVQHGAEGPRPPGDRPAMPIGAAATLIGGGLEVCGPSQPQSTKAASFTAAPRDRRPPCPWGSASNGLHSSSLRARTRPVASYEHLMPALIHFFLDFFFTGGNP